MTISAIFRPAAAAAAVLAGLTGVAQATTVDLFEFPQPRQSIDIKSGTQANQAGPDGSILGGYRDLVVQVISNPEDTFASAAAGKTGAGVPGFTFSAGSENKSIGRIQWDGDDSAGTIADLKYTGLGGANLVFQPGCPVIGCSFFAADVRFADQGFKYSIGIYTDATNYTILTSTVPFPVNSSTLATYDFSLFALPTGSYAPFPTFQFDILQGGAGATLTNVGAIEFTVNILGGTTAVDLTLGSVTKQGVPEPATLALLGLGLLGAAATKRRGKKQSS